MKTKLSRRGGKNTLFPGKLQKDLSFDDHRQSSLTTYKPYDRFATIKRN